MRISNQSTVASCLSSRFRLLAKRMETHQKTRSKYNVSGDDLHLILESSDFPKQLRRYGTHLRNLNELTSLKSISANEEMFYVLEGIKHCLANSRKLSLEQIATLRQDLDAFEEVVKPALENLEGRRCYRLIARAMRSDKDFDFDPILVDEPTAVRLCHYGKKPRTAMAEVAAQVAHTSFEKFQDLCNVCPIVASPGSEYCVAHSPSVIGKKGYSRGQRVFDFLHPNRPARGNRAFNIAPHQQWRKEIWKENESDPNARTVWISILVNELEKQFGDGWEGKVMTVIPAFFKYVGGEHADTVFINVIDPLDVYSKRHPRYFAKKLVEFYVFEKANAKLKKRNVVSYEKLLEVVENNNGSTLAAAVAVGLSRRRVQAILRFGRNRRVGARTD